MSEFYSNEQVSLDKEIETRKDISQTSLENIKDVYEIERCVEWIKTNNFKRVCLQFPDYLLPDSVEVSYKLQEALDQTVYIMGDTAYESCCLDFIAAAHVTADSIIHYGSVCFSQTSNNLPHLNIYEKFEIDVLEFKEKLISFLEAKETFLNVLIDTPYIHKLGKIEEECSKLKNVKIIPLDEKIDYSEKGLYIYIGNNGRKLENIQYSLDEQYLYQYEPSIQNPCICSFQENLAVIKRRYYLAEKIKDSETFAIVMGTLAVDNYLKILGRMKKLLKLNGKKYYVISVGKISVAKLANFPEMDIYIVITCAMNEVYDSKEFYKPIVTPYDVEKAFNIKSDGLKFTYDYNSFLDKVTSEEDLKPVETTDVSLLTGKLRCYQTEVSQVCEGGGEVVLKTDGALVESTKFGAGYLAERSWKGLEQDLGNTEVQLAKEGRTGIAQSYSNEIEKNEKT